MLINCSQMCCSIQAFVIGLAFLNYVTLLTIFHSYALQHFVPKNDSPTLEEVGKTSRQKVWGFLWCLLCFFC